MVRLKQSWVLREGNTPGFPARLSVFEQLGQPGPQRNSRSVCHCNALHAALGHCSLFWNTIKWDNTRMSSHFLLANKDQGLFSMHS